MKRYRGRGAGVSPDDYFPDVGGSVSDAATLSADRNAAADHVTNAFNREEDAISAAANKAADAVARAANIAADQTMGAANATRDEALGAMMPLH